MDLGKLEKVDIRAIWKNEEADFSKWLAREENLSLLGDEIGISMHLLEREACVGKFSADIVAQEDLSGRKVVIENQLEQTDHDHFGKLFTYGSGLDADILIWICGDVREEHRQAVDWLNEKTNKSIAIFMIKMEVWKIGGSPPAPKFQVVCSPNDWAKTLKDELSDGTPSETNLRQLDYWTDFNTYVKDNNGSLRLRKPQPQHWYDVSIEGIPTSNAYLSLVVAFSKSFVRCDLYIPNNKELYNRLALNRAQIESDLGLKLTWSEQPKAKATTIGVKKDKVPLQERPNWRESHGWLMDTAAKFTEVFARYYSL